MRTGLAGRSSQYPQHEQAHGQLHSGITFGNSGTTAAILAQNAGPTLVASIDLNADAGRRLADINRVAESRLWR